MQEQRGEKNVEKSSPRRSDPRVAITVRCQIRAEEKDPLVMDPLKKVTLDGPKKFTYIMSLLSNEERE